MIFKRPRIGKAVKLSFFISMLMAIMSILLSFSFLRFGEKQIKMGMINRGMGIAKALSRNCEYGVLVEDQEILYSAVESMLADESVLYAIIRNRTGEIIVSYGELTDMSADQPIETYSKSDWDKVYSYKASETELMYNIACNVFRGTGCYRVTI